MLMMRRIEETDHGYIMDTFRRGTPTVDTGVPESVVTGLFLACLNRWDGLVACDTETPSEIIGWIVFKPASNVIAWVYVRAGFRNKSIGHMLVLAATPALDIVAPFVNYRYIRKGLLAVSHRPLTSLT